MSIIRILLALALLSLGAVVGNAQTLNYAAAETNQGEHVLNPQNVLWMAFALDPKADRLARARAYLEARELQRYASNMHDEQALLAESRIKADEIDAELGRLDRKQWYSIDIQALAVAVEGQKVTLSTAFNTGLYSIPTDFGTQNKYFPPLFEFIISNAGAFQHFEVSQGRAAEYKNIIASQGPQAAYVRAELELVAFQQGRRFQTVIRRMQWYSDYARTKLISEVTDKRNARKLIASGPLSEGATLDVVPEHAYLVAGERMLETFPLDLQRQRKCSEGPREKGHRVLVCVEERDWLHQVPVTAQYHYVGGRLVEVRARLRQGTTLDQAKRDDIARQAQREFNGPPMIQPALTEWSYGATHFKLAMDVLVANDSTRDFIVASALAYGRLKKGEAGTGVLP